MKKYLSFILVAMVVTLMGCEMSKSENPSISVLENSKIDHLSIKFKKVISKISDNREIELVKEMLGGDLERNKELDGKKGWIYKINANDKDDNELEEVYIVDETTVMINEKAYTCSKIDLSKLDKISGIVRDKMGL